MAPFEFLYGRPCRTPLSWDRLEDRVLVGLEVIQEMEEQMKMIKGRLKEAQDRQKSYVDAHRVDRNYKVGDKYSCGETKRAQLSLVKELSCHHDMWDHLKFLKERDQLLIILHFHHH
jgi:hypothetical protein